MSEKSIKLSNKNEAWQLRLHRGERGCFAMLEDALERMSITTRLSSLAFSFYENMPSPFLINEDDLDHEKVVSETRDLEKKDGQIVIGITGRSGSGKSTLAKKVEEKFIEEDRRVTIISTDDYNRGKKEIIKLTGVDHENGENINWDSHTAYDIDELHWDLQRARWWIPTYGRRRFDFATSESIKIDEFLEPAEVMIVEGIMANSPILREDIDKHYVINTPLATCIGRRVVRDTSGRGVTWSAEEILRYQLEVAEPEYRKRLK